MIDGLIEVVCCYCKAKMYGTFSDWQLRQSCRIVHCQECNKQIKLSGFDHLNPCIEYTTPVNNEIEVVND